MSLGVSVSVMTPSFVRACSSRSSPVQRSWSTSRRRLALDLEIGPRTEPVVWPARWLACACHG